MSEHGDRLPDDLLPSLEADRVPAPARRASTGRRLLVVGAVAALLAGVVVLADQRGDDGPPDDDDEDAEVVVEPVVLQLLGPRDGNESVGLPVSAEPATGLVDGQRVAVTGSGFVPGEAVGIVQCADALADQPGDAVDTCDIGLYIGATATSDGLVTGSYVVRRHLTTPRTGTVDCLLEVRRCHLAIGALDDYDRSGGVKIEFATTEGPGGDTPPAAVVPLATVTPLVGLADGDTILVDGTGFTPGDALHTSLCALDPDVCWELTAPGATATDAPALTVGADGRVSGDLQVWRYLPGPQPGTYVDCAISQCQLHLEGTSGPAPITLGFTPGGDPPTGAAMAIDPADGLAPGDPVSITGAGFDAGATIGLSICASVPGDPPQIVTCATLVLTLVADDDGAFTVSGTVPTFEPDPTVQTTSCGAEPGQCQSGPPTLVQVTCDGVGTSCALHAFIAGTPSGVGRPTFPPAPVPVTYRG